MKKTLIYNNKDISIPANLNLFLAVTSIALLAFLLYTTFSTRAAGVPILSTENRKKFGIWIDENVFSVSPYWDHATMSASGVGKRVRYLQLRLMRERLSLNAFAFYSGMLGYRPEDRETLLDFQADSVKRFKTLPKFFKIAVSFIEKRIQRDINKLKAVKEPSPPVKQIA